jgi:hypothetical protein
MASCNPMNFSTGCVTSKVKSRSKWSGFFYSFACAALQFVFAGVGAFQRADDPAGFFRAVIVGL